MLTIVLTYRNRDLTIVKRCLDSLSRQCDIDFEVFLVDYGSDNDYKIQFQILSEKYSFVNHQYVDTCGQLWNKSRAINIALKQCTSQLFCVADIDLLFHPEFVKKSIELYNQFGILYFQTGFLDQLTTQKWDKFMEAEVAFVSESEVTGITVYETEVLKSINGYDEFYHGWGAEDTDVHLRLKNGGYNVYFYQEEILVKHQWHPKAYRSKNSSAPFHTTLEKINHAYMLMQNSNKVTVANSGCEWGILPLETQVNALNYPEYSFHLTTVKDKFDAFLMGIFPSLNQSTKVIIKEDIMVSEFKNKIKKILKKKYIAIYTIEEANNLLLGRLISDYRLSSYNYHIDWSKKEITLTIAPYAAS